MPTRIVRDSLGRAEIVGEGELQHLVTDEVRLSNPPKRLPWSGAFDHLQKSSAAIGAYPGRAEIVKRKRRNRASKL